MSTPLIQLLPPPGPTVFKAPVSSPFTNPDVPPLFLSALSVRIPVFVDEQHCSAANEIDEDDPRSFHWVVYLSADKTAERPDGKVAAGTIRLVPVAPLAGLTDTEKQEDEKRGEQAVGPKHGATEMWDGKEAFVKLGRMATLKAYRNLGLGRMLVGTALEWLEGNADKVMGEMGMGIEDAVRREKGEWGEWKGLVLVHAQKEIERFWASVGFVMDEGMGNWWEEGIEHVGMWKRVSLK